MQKVFEKIKAYFDTTDSLQQKLMSDETYKILTSSKKQLFNQFSSGQISADDYITALNDLQDKIDAREEEIYSAIKDTHNTEAAQDIKAANNSLARVVPITAEFLLDLQKNESPTSTYFKQQANLLNKQATELQRQEQQEQQIANKDYRQAAEQEALSQNAALNQQKINNSANVLGAGAAALQRNTTAADYNTHRNRQDETRRKAAEYNADKHGLQSAAIDKQSEQTREDYMYKEKEQANRQSDALSADGYYIADPNIFTWYR